MRSGEVARSCSTLCDPVNCSPPGSSVHGIFQARVLLLLVHWKMCHSDLVIYTVNGFSTVNEAEVDVFLKLSCFIHDPTNVGNFISDSSASLQPILYIWMFSVHVLLKPSLENFEHNLASMWDECNCKIDRWFLTLSFSWIGMKTDLFQSCGHCCVFWICWHIEWL